MGLRLALERAEGLADGEYDRIVAEVDAEVDAAIAFAESSPWPPLETAGSGVTEIDPNLRGNP
jgi:TPP-dependent pyruvate/acetoin dehydrogenase alpha subunit